MSETILCVVRACGNPAQEQHHLWPTHLGGPVEGPTIWLCPNCHRDIHKIASRMYRGKPIGIFKDNWLQAAQPIIMRIVRALREFEGANLDNIEARLVIKLPKNKLRRIHLRKMDLGFSSLEKYIIALIDADLPLN